jgi:purine-binding chemotaxis protein CheW
MEAIKDSNKNSVQRISHDGKYLTFLLGDEQYGIEILKVVEIIGYMQITEIPQIPDYILGIINLRNKIIPIMDLRLRFHLDKKQADVETVIIVIQTEKVNMGIVVDKVLEVINITDANIEDTPNFGVSITTDYILGMAKLNNKVTILLSIEGILTDEMKELASETARIANMAEMEVVQ